MLILTLIQMRGHPRLPKSAEDPRPRISMKAKNPVMFQHAEVSVHAHLML